MLQVNKLTFTHIKDLRVILKDFNMVLNKGDKAVIIGEEGNGKSTLLKWIYHPELVSDYVEYQGSISYSNEVLGYLPQELAQEDKQKTIYEFFLDCDAFLDQSPKALGSYASRFNIPVELFYSDQLMGSLSGGEKIKLQLIRILMMSPTILLLDEPSNDLDLPSLELLESIINEFDHIVLFISHDETLIENTANMIIHLEQIKRKTESRYTVVRKNYRQYVEDRNNALDYQNQQFLNDRREKKLRDEKYQRVQQSVEHALRNVSRQAPSEAKNLKDKVHTIKAMGKRFEKEDAKMTQRVEVEEA
ncbi:MAG: ABC-F family ATP-binding cassette domain-containing protein, partial [Erysipelotrichaceae bacterium]|nr:ABC-F family ATP-binding cassette domain-containing protein [Erysipelotrichaceae bacterium]